MINSDREEAAREDQTLTLLRVRSDMKMWGELRKYVYKPAKRGLTQFDAQGFMKAFGKGANFLDAKADSYDPARREALHGFTAYIIRLLDHNTEKMSHGQVIAMKTRARELVSRFDEYAVIEAKLNELFPSTDRLSFEYNRLRTMIGKRRSK